MTVFKTPEPVADEAIKNTNMFPQNLPSEMHKKVDNEFPAHFCRRF